MSGAQNLCVAPRPRLRACKANHAKRVDALSRNRKGSWRRALVRERQGSPYIPVFQIRLRFNAVSSVASRRSAPDTEIPAQDQCCSERIGCSGEKRIPSPSNYSTEGGAFRALIASRKEKPGERERGESGMRRAKA